MTEKIDENIIGFYASFNADETDEELVRSYLWSDNGLKSRLSHLKWKNYGQSLQIILFQVYVRPIPYMRKNLREIENYRPKEKSIGISIILDNENFFNLSETDRQQFFVEIIIDKLGLMDLKVKRNKLDFDISQLIADVKKSLNYQTIEKKQVANNNRKTMTTEQKNNKSVNNKSIWSKLKSKWF